MGLTVNLPVISRVETRDIIYSPYKQNQLYSLSMQIYTYLFCE